jgi:hypothetical protein
MLLMLVGVRSDAALTAEERAAAERILGAELVDSQAFAILEHLTDRIGARLSGSVGAERAVAWTAERLTSDGLRARTEKVMVPHWVRGGETGEITAPIAAPLALTALGGSDGTPEKGLLAPVVEAFGLDALKALGPGKVRGRIVLLNHTMNVAADYGPLSSLRVQGAIEAARLGAVGVLVRSLSTLDARLAHTGMMRYEKDLSHIPAAAVAAEDADLLHRLLANGETVEVRLRLTCRTLPDVESANVVADLVGRERPDEVVVIGAHLDSWDLATGAIDDGAGVAMVMESLRLLRALGLQPRRTIRGVLYMNEENGDRGGEGYAADHAPQLARHVAALEADSGAGRPTGFTVVGGDGAVAAVAEIASLLQSVGADSARAETYAGTDIDPMRQGGVPLLGLRQDATHYFDWHHSAADTLDKVKPNELAMNAAAMAVMAYVLAEHDATLPRPAPAQP